MSGTRRVISRELDQTDIRKLAKGARILIALFRLKKVNYEIVGYAKKARP